MSCMKHRCSKCDYTYNDDDAGSMHCHRCGGRMEHSFYEPKECRGDWDAVYYDGENREKQESEGVVEEVQNMEPSGETLNNLVAKFPAPKEWYEEWGDE